MPVPQFPTELCERIIDFVPFDSDPNGGAYGKRSRDTIYACSLVCRSWVPRSQYHLFLLVQLSSSRQAKAFFDVVTHSPTIGKGVLTLIISPTQEVSRETPNPPNFFNWIYRALATLPSFLTNITTLQFERLPTLHPSFVVLVSRFGTVERLFLNDLSNQSFCEIIQMVNRFPRLTSFRLLRCQWTQPAHYYANQRHQLKMLHNATHGDCRRDVLNWASSSRCLSGIQSLIFESVDTLLITEMDRCLRQCTHTLRYLFIGFDVGTTLGKFSTIA